MKKPHETEAPSFCFSLIRPQTDFLAAFALATLVLFLSLLLTAIITWQTKQIQQKTAAEKFKLLAAQNISLIEKHLLYYHQVLHSMQALFLSSHSVTRDEFQAYVKSLKIQKFYPGIQNVGIARIIPPEQKSTHVQTMRKIYPNYHLWPTGNHRIRTAVVQVEMNKVFNHRGLGYDMYANPARRAAMNVARDTGKPAITAKVDLLIKKDGKEEAGVIIYAPIYRFGYPIDTQSARRKNIVGWIYTPLSVNDLFTHLNFEASNGLAVDFFDGKSVSEKQLLFRASLLQTASLPRNPQLEKIHQLSFMNRQWTLLVRPLASFDSPLRKWIPVFIACCGILFSILLTLLTWSLAAGRTRAMRLANQMRLESWESESRFKHMANAAPVMIWLSDSKYKHTWINRKWMDFLGEAYGDDIGGSWQNCIHPDDLPALEKNRAACLQKHEPYFLEFRAKRHDGVYRWLTSRAVPRFDETGAFLGYVGSCEDITEQKEVEVKASFATLLFNHSADAMCVCEYVDEDTLIILSVNQAHENITGRPAASLQGQNIKCLASERHPETFYTRIANSLKESGHWEGEYWAKKSNGSYFPSWLDLKVVEEGSRKRVIVLMRDITQQKESETTIRALSKNLITAREKEAKRIAREIHDDLGQHLHWARLHLKLMLERKSAQITLDETPIKKITASIDSCLKTMKQIAMRLRPSVLDMGFELALNALVEEFTKNTGIQCDILNKIEVELKHNEELAINLFRIVQEALTNIARHANASYVLIALVIEEGELRMGICDNGRGFDSSAPVHKGSYGLAGMKERIAILGGSINILSRPGIGVSIHLFVPCIENFIKGL